MSTIYFHHYETSPFAEKVRRILAYKGLPWSSVLQPPIMPKPDLVALTNGYRRIPVLQIGNDVICDTPLICDVLEALQPSPSLYPAFSGGTERVVAQWADSQVFAAAMAYNFSPAGAAGFFKGVSPDFAKTFAEDRKAMRSGGARMMPADATPAYKEYLLRINNMLDRADFLCGPSPTVADFSAYHPLWFTRRINEVANVLAIYPKILPWMDRVAALGTEHRQEATAQDALAACRLAKSTVFDGPFVNEHGIALGSQVGIVAESFGTEVTTGVLVSATENRLVLEHSNDHAGTVRVHFPRVGFSLKAI